MVKVAPEGLSSLTGTCLVSALSWVNSCFFLVGAAPPASEGGLIGRSRRRGGFEGEPENRQSLLGIPFDSEDALAPRHLHEVVAR